VCPLASKTNLDDAAFVFHQQAYCLPAKLPLRGELSDLLTRETANEMTRRGPRAKLAEIRGVGHAPTLLHPDQIAVVRDFLLQGT